MLNRQVFSLRLKLARVPADLTDSGRLFHTVGPATEKVWSPNLVLVRGTMKSRLLAERRRRHTRLLLTGWADSLRYAGQRLSSRTMQIKSCWMPEASNFILNYTIIGQHVFRDIAFWIAVLIVQLSKQIQVKLNGYIKVLKTTKITVENLYQQHTQQPIDHRFDCCKLLSADLR